MRPEPEGMQLPPTPQTPRSPPVNNPLVDDAIAGMNAPQHGQETNEAYAHRRNTAMRYENQVAFGLNQDQLKQEPSTVDYESSTSRSRVPTLRGNEEFPHARICMADRFKDREAFQHLRNSDLATRGVSLYDDQGIIFRKHQAIDAMKEMYLKSMGQAPAPNEPGGGNDPDDPDEPPPRDDLPYNQRRGTHDRTPRGGPGGGDGDGNPPDGDDNEGDDDQPPSHNRPTPPHRGYSMPTAGQTRLRTPGVQAIIDHHRDQMHNRLIRLCRQCLDTHIRIPNGTKLRRIDSNSVGQYKGSPSFQDLELWLTRLTVLLQAS
jgi:hypothetical protein